MSEKLKSSSGLCSTDSLYVLSCRYSGNPKYIGGAVAFSAEDFRKINGFPNTFWGWGGEDDEMYKRMTEVGRVSIRVALAHGTWLCCRRVRSGSI